MINRPDRDEWLMRIAAYVSTRGTCMRASVGAVIAKEGRIISTGYVGSPSGQPHCIPDGCEIGDDGGCTRTVHAEANAIAFAARFGTGVDGSKLYCTHSPCLACAKLIINAGIVGFVYEHPYRVTSGLTLLESAGLDILQLVAPISGAEVRHERLLEGLTPEQEFKRMINDPRTQDLPMGISRTIPTHEEKLKEAQSLLDREKRPGESPDEYMAREGWKYMGSASDDA